MSEFKKKNSHLVSRLSLAVLQLLGVLLPDGEDPVITAKVVPARRLTILLSDWTDSKIDVVHAKYLKFIVTNLGRKRCGRRIPSQKLLYFHSASREGTQ